MLRSLSSASRSGVRHHLSNPSLRAGAAVAAVPQPPAPVGARSLVSTVLLTNDGGYETKQVTELRTLLRQRGLAAGGRKAQLIQRLKESDGDRAQVALASTAPEGAKRTRSRSKPKGKAAAEAAAEQTPTTTLEPGTVSSPAAEFPGHAGTRSPTKPQERTQTAPGVPEHRAQEESVVETFNVRVPETPADPEEPQYIPTIPTFQPTVDSPKAGPTAGQAAPAAAEPEPQPKVHGVATTEHVSHNASIASADAAEPPKSGITSAIAAEVLPAQVRRQAAERVREYQDKASNALSEFYQETKQSIAHTSDPVETTHSLARASGRRPLRDDERFGLWVLGGILAGGYMLAGYLAPKPSASDEPQKHGHGAQPAPHYEHGGGVVGGVPRKH